mmetsp:Transcript_4887/g.14156  ORF Transcript_4887/g.14156 Transcript_4887/m.14156 type:complete len:222 (-) Transcript_4887:591-1256(-)
MRVVPRRRPRRRPALPTAARKTPKAAEKSVSRLHSCYGVYEGGLARGIFFPGMGGWVHRSTHQLIDGSMDHPNHPNHPNCNRGGRIGIPPMPPMPPTPPPMGGGPGWKAIPPPRPMPPPGPPYLFCCRETRTFRPSTSMPFIWSMHCCTACGESKSTTHMPRLFPQLLSSMNFIPVTLPPEYCVHSCSSCTSVVHHVRFETNTAFWALWPLLGSSMRFARV